MCIPIMCQYKEVKLYILKMRIISLFKRSVAQMVKNLLATQETWIQLLHREDPLEKRMGIDSSIPAWRIPWREGPEGL